jgi:hypothetical protein
VTAAVAVAVTAAVAVGATGSRARSARRRRSGPRRPSAVSGTHGRPGTTGSSGPSGPPATTAGLPVATAGPPAGTAALPAATGPSAATVITRTTAATGPTGAATTGGRARAAGAETPPGVPRPAASSQDLARRGRTARSPARALPDRPCAADIPRAVAPPASGETPDRADISDISSQVTGLPCRLTFSSERTPTRSARCGRLALAVDGLCDRNSLPDSTNCRCPWASAGLMTGE